MAASSTCSSTFDANLNLQQQQNQIPMADPSSVKRKRNQPGNPNPDAEVIALSPKTLMATNRFVCEVCNKGFQREQNLQLHRRGHNLPWNLKQKNNGGSKELIRKKVYLCPEPTCVHHDPTRALGDLTGIKKHYSRKHGEKKYRCEKCSKKYAVQSDWKAHSKTCGTREYRCDCGTIFSRRDSFITHRAFCNALAEESARNLSHPQFHFSGSGSGSENGNRIGNTIANHHHLHLIGGQNHQNLSLPNHDFFRYAGGSHFDNLIGSLPSAFCIPSRPPFMHQQQQLPQLHGAGSSSGPLNLGFFPVDGGGGDYPSLFTYGGNYGSFMHIPDIPNPAYMSATALLQKSGIYASMTGETDSSSQLGFEKPEEYHNLSSIGLPFVPGLYNHHHHQDVDEYAGFCGESKVENSSNLHGIMELGEDGKLTRDFLGVGEIMGVHQHQRKRINTMENHIKPTPQGDPFN